MPAQTNLVRVVHPFTGGLRDAPTKAEEAALLEDALYPLDVACERGGWTTRGSASSLGVGQNAQAVLEEIITPTGLTTADILLARQGLLSVATSGARDGLVPISFFMGGAGVSNHPLLHFMRGLFNGEVLILPQDGETPIMLFAGNFETADNTVATITVVAGSTVTTAGSAIFASTDVGRYIRITGALIHGFRRIEHFVSSTVVTVDEPWDSSATGFGRFYSLGRLGLFTELTRLGKATKNGVGTTITGTGTAWTTSPPGSGRPAFFAGAAQSKVDTIAPVGVDYGSPLYVDTVTNATAIETGIASATWGVSAVDYRIGRPLVGKVACVHENRLFVAGVKWAKRRLYMTPAFYAGRSAQNGEFSYEVEIGRAVMCAHVPVPGDDAPGELNGLMTLPNGNLAILSTNDVHVGWGQYPAFSFDKVADFGNFDGRSCLAVDEGAWFAGPEGVFEFRGNEPRNIIEGHLDKTWRELMREPPVEVMLGMLYDHLIVQVDTANQSKTLIYDRRRRNWPGVWSLPSTISYMYPSRVPGQKDRLLAAYANTVPAELESTIVDHETAIAVTTNPGTFRAITPETIAGDLSREREVKYVKPSYQLVGTSSPVLRVSPGPDAPAVHTSLAATTGEAIATETLFPKSDTTATGSKLGVRTNRFDVTLERNGGTVTRLAVHELELLVKEYRHRGG